MGTTYFLVKNYTHIHEKQMLFGMISWQSALLYELEAEEWTILGNFSIISVARPVHSTLNLLMCDRLPLLYVYCRNTYIIHQSGQIGILFAYLLPVPAI